MAKLYSHECYPRLMALGLDLPACIEARRIAIQLRNWFEGECGTERGCIEREGENGDGKPFWHSSFSGKKWRIPDRERGAIVRLDRLRKRYPDLIFYVQGDPRGASLFVLTKDQVPPGEHVDGFYSRGVAVYK